jgi:hypothetical protein
MTALVAIDGMLDLDHLCTEYSQLISGERPGQDMGDVQYFDAFKGSHEVGLAMLDDDDLKQFLYFYFI